ncbi:peptidase S8/S53 domain-containing protein [Colletotrichum cereale]|nr:peptidase S8/S53 domain-containing protein [Colletotrichum cereale]
MHTYTALILFQPTQSRTTSTISTASIGPRTIENGEVVSDVAVGAIIAAGVGGGYLLLSGIYFSLAAGSVVQVTGAAGVSSGLNSLSGPQPEQVESPEEPPNDRQPTPTGQKSRQQESTTQLRMSSSPTSSAPHYSTSTQHTSSSASSSAVPRYIIVPVSSDSGSGSASLDSVRSIISESAGSEMVSVEDGEDNTTLFFTAPLAPETINKLESNAGVESVSENFVLGDIEDLRSELPFNEGDAVGPSGQPPTLTTDPLSVAKQPKNIVRQQGYGHPQNVEEPDRDRALELQMISQEPGQFLGDFMYDEVAGQGITVYILGSGMNLQAPDIKNATGAKDFLYVPDAAETPTDDSPHTGFRDGSCMASKIFGPQFGVAKKANVVMVKLNAGNGASGQITWVTMLTALAMVKNDIHKRGIKGRAVVNLSYTTPIADQEAIKAYKEILVKMMEDDIVLVAPTGISRNNNGSEANDQYPAAFAKDTALIAVNGVSSKGLRVNWSPGSERDGVTVAAPVTGFCADRAFDPDDRETLLDRRYYSSGVASATVTGVIATLMAQEEYKEQIRQSGMVASKVKELLQGLAWVRAEGGPPVVWNGVRSTHSACRRQEGDSCSSSASTTHTTTPTAPSTSLANASPATSTVASTSITQPLASVAPVPCYNFDVATYGYCCAGPNNPCERDQGKCYFGGEGVYGGATGVVPNGARCPPPPGAEYCRGVCDA